MAKRSKENTGTAGASSSQQPASNSNPGKEKESRELQPPRSAREMRDRLKDPSKKGKDNSSHLRVASQGTPQSGSKAKADKAEPALAPLQLPSPMGGKSNADLTSPVNDHSKRALGKGQRSSALSPMNRTVTDSAAIVAATPKNPKSNATIPESA
jgi:hypothetical protein